MTRSALMSAAFACTAVVAGASSVSAATCADRTHVVTQLEQRFGETLRGNATTASNDAMLEIFATPRSETWTILVSLPDRGLSCLVASGRGERRLNAKLLTL